MASQSVERTDGNVEDDGKHKVVSLLEYLLQNPELPVSGGRERLIAVLSGESVLGETIPLDSDDRRDPDDIPGPLRVSEQ